MIEYKDKMNRILSHKILTREEERDLFKELSLTTCPKRRDAIISKIYSCNIRLITKNVSNYYKRVAQYFTVSYEDLFQEASIGLLTAINKFDISKNNKFSTYASIWIAQKISRYVQNTGKMIRLPSHIILKANKLTAATEKINRTNNVVTHEDLFELTGIPENQQKKILSKVFESSVYFFSEVMLMTGFASSAEESLDNYFINPKTTENQVEESLLQKDLKEAIQTRLTAKERFIIESRYGLGKDPETLDVLSKQLNISRQAVSQFEIAAKKKLKKSKKLQGYLND